MQNFGGVIIEKIKPLDLQFGGLTTIEDEIIFPEGCYKYLPDFEEQTSLYFESNTCVAQSADNAMETDMTERVVSEKISIENLQWLKWENYFKNGKINFNDRALAIASGTDPEAGNSLARVYQTAKEQGLASENIWPWDWRERDAKINNKKNFWNGGVLPVAVKEQMTEFKKRFDIVAEWVEIKDWKEAEKRGALQTCVWAWKKRGDKYYNPYPGKYNHAVQETSIDLLEVFDTYQPKIKQLESEADFYGWALKFNVFEKRHLEIMDKPKIENNSLVFCAEGAGEFGLYLDGNIIVDDLVKVLAVWFMRTPDREVPKKKTITLAQWNLFSKIDLKGRTITK